MKTSILAVPLPILLLLSLVIAVPGCPPPSSGWVRLHGGDGSDYGLCVQQTTDGGYVFAGTTHSFGTTNGNMYLVKTNANGYISWYYTYGAFAFEHGYRVVQADDGGYVMAETTSPGAGEIEACLVSEGWSPDPFEEDNGFAVKTDEDGVQEWSRRFGGTGPLRSEGTGVVESVLGGYCMVGSQYNDSTDDWSLYTVKTDANGNTGLPLPVLWLP